MRPFRTALAMMTMCLPLAVRAQSAPPAELDTTRATLAPGDLLRITVWRRPEFSGDFVIAPDSTITHPLYREVKVAAVPLSEVENRVRRFLGKYENTPAFVISPLLRVFVGGEVRQPSVYSVPPGTTVAQAVALAGGPTERGKLDEVLLVRRDTRRALDLTSTDVQVAATETRSGDQVFVARRRNFFLDVLAPSSSVIAAGASLASIIIQLRR